jgi:hypothetical protein
MDKGLETLYNKLSNLFHPNTPGSSSSNASSASESNTLLPISTFFDRIIPSATNSPSNDRRRSLTRGSHQISTKRNDHRFGTHFLNTTPVDITKQQQQ